MEDERYYPRIDENPVMQARRIAAADAGYLTDPTCPYSADLKTVLAPPPDPKAQIQEERARKTREGSLDLGDEISRVYEEMQEFGRSLDKEDKAELNTYFRVSVSLLEKLMELQERAVGVSKVKEFTENTLTIMEDELTPDQRGAIMARLKAIIER